MKMKLKTLKIITSPNVQGLLIFKRNEASLSQGQVLRIMAKAKCGPKIQLAMSVRGHTQSHASHASSRKSGGSSLARVHSPRLASAAKRADLQADAATLHKPSSKKASAGSRKKNC